jgi:hypothetical protein
MDIIEFYRDFSVETAPDGHKHHQPGWVNIECPFCTGEHAGYHLGYNIDGNYYHCWRCGGKPVWLVISRVIDVSRQRAEELIREYKGTSPQPQKDFQNQKPFKLPTDTGDLSRHHRKYLRKRSFSPSQLIRDWNIQGTGPIASLNDGEGERIDYRNRILVPIIWDDQIVSFQARDITDKHSLKYKACPQLREKIHHKDIIYGRQDKWGEVGIGVEGVFDVWRLGFQSVGTFGIEFTHRQVRIIAKNFKRFVTVFDPDPQAKEQAKKLTAELQFRRVDASYEIMNTDPGDMTNEEAEYLVKYINKKFY